MSALGKFFVCLVVLWLFIGLNATICNPPMLTGVNVAIEVYEDINANGQRDIGEPPIPNVMVSKNFYPGGPQTWFTDANGKATVTGRYRSDMYMTGILPPCGYKPNKLPIFDPSAREFQIGFIPEKPQTELATITFHIWYDSNQNGIWESTELPAADRSLSLKIYQVDLPGGIDYGSPPSPDGIIVVAMGNSCATLSVSPMAETTVFTANGNPIMKVERSVQLDKYGWDTDWYEFNYSPGITNVNWGLIETPAETPRPATIPTPGGEK